MFNAGIIRRIVDYLLNVFIVRCRALLLPVDVLNISLIDDVTNFVYVELPVAEEFVNINVLASLF